MQPWVVMVRSPTARRMEKVNLRCGSHASPVNAEAPAGETYMTSMSPTFSSVTPGLIQVLTAQSSCPQSSTLTRALPSPLAQSPSGDGGWAAAAPARVTTPNRAAVTMGATFSINCQHTAARAFRFIVRDRKSGTPFPRFVGGERTKAAGSAYQRL